MLRNSLLLMALVVPLAASAQTIPLKNADFEGGATAAGLPVGWGQYISSGTARSSVEAAVAHGGKAALRLAVDEGSRCTVSQVGPTAEAGLYSFGVWLKTDLAAASSAYIYLQWHDAAGKTVLNDRPSKALKGPKDWTEVVTWGERPQTATSVLCVIVVEAAGDKGGTVWADDAELRAGVPERFLKPVPSEDDNPLQMPIRPNEGQVVLQNPPDFSWNPQEFAGEYEFQLSPDAQFPAAQTFTKRTLYNVYSHSAQLAQGTWHWRVRFATRQKQWSDWLPTRSFVVTAQAQPFVVPSPEEMLARIPQGHPRLYATAATLATFRAPLQGAKKEWWTAFSQRLDRYLAKPVEQEPDEAWRMGDRPGGGGLTDAEVEAGNKLRSYCGQVNDRLQSLAFGYLLTGERKYADAAIAQMLEMATWDPKGVTSYKNQDQVFRDIAWMTATAYDWCWEVMTPEQRKTVGDSIIARARTLYEDFQGRSRPLYAYPYDSHGITAYGFLGICALALAREYPEADEWLRFVVATYPAVFPPWGGEEGGWSQGVGYWKWSQSFAWYFFEALKSATGVDLYQKAFCRNTGFYKLYMHPPWCDRHHFGDGNHGSPDAADLTNMARMANAYDNPYYQWYAKNMPGKPDHGIFGYWWFDESKPVRPPANLPQGRYFSDIGWVAMHSDLSDPNDIMLMFKSSPFGSFNHSHADQNSFVLYGYGEPLLIDSGYYDWYGSPHHAQYTIQTKAHNTVLVNGEGQPPWDKSATGKITDYFGSPAVEYAAGDATTAYQGKLKRFTRKILYLRPNAFLIVDELEAPEPSTFTWMLHAENEMKLAEDKQEVMVTRGGARCLVKFLAPQPLKLQQTGEFDPPPTRKLANEWHTSVSTTEKATRCRFVTFIRPCPASEPAEALEVKAQFKDDLLLLAWGTDPKPGGIIAAWLGKDPAFTVIGPGSAGAVASVIDAREVNLDDAQGRFQLLSSDLPLRATLELRGKDNANVEVWRATYQATQPTAATLRVRQAVKALRLDGKPLATGAFRWADEKLSLKLPAGAHVLEVNPGAGTAGPKTTLFLEGQPLATTLQSEMAYTGGTLSWGSFAASAVPAQVEALKAPAGTEAVIGAVPLHEGQSLWLAPTNTLTVRSTSGEGEVGIALKRLITNPEPLTGQVVEPAVERTPGVIRFEAENFVDSGGGLPNRYTNRPFLSSGVGVGNWTTPGMWIEWKLNVARAGKYAVALKCATHEPFADRMVTLDGKALGTEHRVVRVPSTKGFGATPEEWRLVQLPQPLDLAAGQHQLRLTCLANLLNVDYLVLVPLP